MPVAAATTKDWLLWFILSWSGRPLPAPPGSRRLQAPLGLRLGCSSLSFPLPPSQGTL